MECLWNLYLGLLPACRILAKYFRIKDGLEIFSVVKKLYFSSYKADIQAQVSTPLENSSLCLILWERHENVVWGTTPASWEAHMSCRGRFWAVCCLQLHAFDIFPDHLGIPFAHHKRALPPATEVCPELWVGVDFAICASSFFRMYGIDKITHSFFKVTGMLGLNPEDYFHSTLPK